MTTRSQVHGDLARASIITARSSKAKFGGEPRQGSWCVLNGDKGWRKFGDMEPMEMDGDASRQREAHDLPQVIPTTLVPLKGKGFKARGAGRGEGRDKPAAGIKVTGPDGKDFTLYFDKESGLPVRLVATVIGFGGEEFTQETTYKDYKDFDGIKKATKAESKRDGEDFVEVRGHGVQGSRQGRPGDFQPAEMRPTGGHASRRLRVIVAGCRERRVSVLTQNHAGSGRW